MRDAAGAAGDLRRRLNFVEAVLRGLGGVQDEEESLEQVARLALHHLALACWIFIREDGGAVRLGRAAQSGASRPPATPPVLLERIKALLGRRARKRVHTGKGSPVMVSLLEHDGERLGAIALLPDRAPGTSLAWMSGVLAAQAAAAIARVRVQAKLRHAVVLRDDVFAAAAHELGNSLAALALQVRALVHEDAARSGGVPFAPRLDAMDVQVSRLIALNRRVLDSSRLSSGRFLLRLTKVDAAEVLREVLARNADELAWRRCSVDFQHDGPVAGRWDRGLLDQIFSNLLSNAMKYGHSRPIAISLRGSAAFVRFRIEDHGIGIAAADHQRIFEKFERAAPIEQGTSLGIGLWLVKRMTQALGGAIHLTSVPGAGSIFTVKLPRRAPARRSSRERST